MKLSSSIVYPLSSIFVFLCIAGCGATKQESQAQGAVDVYKSGNYTAAMGKLKPLASSTDENFVLNNARLGLTALAYYDLDEAEAAFLRAYEVINSTGVNKGGRDVAAVLINEKHKIWKGEPFERAMVNFYLGLVYYTRHDYENARAAFENSLFKLRDYGEDKNDKGDAYKDVESDFALGYLMLAKAFQRLGNETQARKNFDRLVELRPKLKGMADAKRHADSNVLLVIDYGYGPRRKNEQLEGAILAFTPRPEEAGPIPLPRVSVNGRPVAGPRTPYLDMPPVDLLALAQDKRWQSIDTIRTIKSLVGTGLIAGGAYQATRAHEEEKAKDRNKDYGGAVALIGAGLLLKATSQADVRTWEMLPRTCFVVPLKLAPGKHDLVIDFPDAQGLTQSWRGIEAPSAGEATYYFRIQPRLQGPYTWPPPAYVKAKPPTATPTPVAARSATPPTTQPKPAPVKTDEVIGIVK
jgi:tetratricopeptide (TPR) repeat protein